MPRPVVIEEGVYAYTGGLPEGCKLCIRGEKIVVFITGLCPHNCFYCPVSPHRFNRDIVYADEELVSNPEGVVQEALAVNARGASITGGEPLLRVGRVSLIIRRLKEALGDDFHIHLYTSGWGLTKHAVRLLEEAGLDELRIHPVERRYWRLVEVALAARGSMRVGVEVPVLPDRVDELKELMVYLEHIGADFINLNEAEVAPHRVEAFEARGYKVRGYVVEGSYEAGISLVKWAAENLERLWVHFCPASYKDRIQHKNRLLRKALRTRLYYEAVTERGTLQHMEAPCSEEIRVLVEEGLGVKRGETCLLHPRAAEKLRTGAWIVETYPDRRRRMVSRFPLNP